MTAQEKYQSALDRIRRWARDGRPDEFWKREAERLNLVDVSRRPESNPPSNAPDN